MEDRNPESSNPGQWEEKFGLVEASKCGPFLW
jgi:hypothetical protein